MKQVKKDRTKAQEVAMEINTLPNRQSNDRPQNPLTNENMEDRSVPDKKE